jgi:hypothetical protein
LPSPHRRRRARRPLYHEHLFLRRSSRLAFTLPRGTMACAAASGWGPSDHAGAPALLLLPSGSLAVTIIAARVLFSLFVYRHA